MKKGDPSIPMKGETKPLKEDPEYRPGGGKYTWLKAPRYDGEPLRSRSAGPRAGGLRQGPQGHQTAGGQHLQEAGRPGHGPVLHPGPHRRPRHGNHRHRRPMETWMGELMANLKGGDTKTYEPWEMPDSGMGVGLNDVPRGSLGHWIKIEGGKIKNYQYVVPSTWNFGPRDAKGKLGPVEEALIGTPIADPKQPLEVLRTVIPSIPVSPVRSM
jgi:[NiFe] hydrogenase large subunit